MPSKLLDVARDGEDALLVVEDRLDDARHRQRHGVEGRALALDDLLAGRHHGLVDPRPRGLVQGRTSGRGVAGERDLAEARHAPHRHRRVAVLADDVGVDVARVDRELLPEQVAEARGVERGAGADDPSRRRREPLHGHVGQDVHRVRDDDHDGAVVVRRDAGEDLLQDRGVAARQVEARLPRLASAPGGDGDDVGVGDALVALGTDLRRCRGRTRRARGRAPRPAAFSWFTSIRLTRLAVSCSSRV